MSENLKRCLDNITARNDDLNAVLDIYEDRSSGVGPVAGLVVGVKANIAVRGQVWHAGIKAYENQKASKDARVVSRLRGAGAIILCNLNMEEGALGAQTDNPWFGKTQNPLKSGYTPGGSSGGSAAAVAADFVDIALGTDTMGSVRVPSGYCGLWGFKPSHAAEMLDGVMPLSPTLDTVGVHAKSFDALLKPSEVITGKSLLGGTAGNVTVLDWQENIICEPSVTKAFEAFVSKHGFSNRTDLSPYAFGKSRMAGLIISEIEGLAIHEHHLQNQPEGFSEHFSDMLNWAGRQSNKKIEGAYTHQKAIYEADLPDFILMPTTPQTAFKFGGDVPANQADFTAFANLADRPAIAFPIGEDDNGMPISAQLVGPRGGEADLVATVRKYANFE